MHPNNKTDRLREQLLTEGGIWRQLVLFSIPIMVGTLFQQLYNMIDAIVVGNFVGITALAAVGGSTQQIIGLILGYFLAPVFLRWMNTPEDTMQGAVLYLKIYFCGIIFLLFYNVGAAILRAVGDTRKPLYYLIICFTLNTVLDLLLRTDDIYRLSVRRIAICGDSLAKMLRIGIPMGMQALMYSTENIIIQMGLNHLGTDTVAAWTVVSKIDAFYWMVLTGFGIAITTFAGQCVRLTLFISIGMSLLFLVCSRGLFAIFTTDRLDADRRTVEADG